MRMEEVAGQIRYCLSGFGRYLLGFIAFCHFHPKLVSWSPAVTKTSGESIPFSQKSLSDIVFFELMKFFIPSNITLFVCKIQLQTIFIDLFERVKAISQSFYLFDHYLVQLQIDSFQTYHNLMSKRAALEEKKQRKKKEEHSDAEVDSDQGSQRPKKETNSNGEEYWALTKYKRVSIGNFKGKVNINLREYFEKDGQMLPTKKGITLNMENWEVFKKLIKDIDKSLEVQSQKK